MSFRQLLQQKQSKKMLTRRCSKAAASSSLFERRRGFNRSQVSSHGKPMEGKMKTRTSSSMTPHLFRRPKKKVRMTGTLRVLLESGTPSGVITADRDGAGPTALAMAEAWDRVIRWPWAHPTKRMMALRFDRGSNPSSLHIFQITNTVLPGASCSWRRARPGSPS